MLLFFLLAISSFFVFDIVLEHLFLRDGTIKELEENGYVVIPNVLCTEECDLYSKEYRNWAKQLDNDGLPFTSFESLIQGHSIGHFNASWQVRLKAKKIFAEIWKTDKLLSSIDAVALSCPPEEGKFISQL